MGVLLPSIALTLVTVVMSRRLAKLIDTMATDGFSVREKLERLGRVLRGPRIPRAARNARAATRRPRISSRVAS